ncbi:MAG: Gfo/Idh/MocA family oxidoreductase [Bryobacterales bacterium]
MKPIERRDFLKTAGAALAAASTAASGAAATGKIRAAVLGTQHSHVRGKLAAMIESPDYEVVSVCEHDPAVQKRQAVNKLFQGLKWVSEDELLGDSSIQLVVVECKPWEAVPWGKKVIAAGKHLHLEKPTGDKYEPFKELIDEARRKKLLLQVGWVLRGHEGIDSAIKAAKEGWIGDVYLLRATINSDRDQPQRDLEAKYPGGSMFELGGHVIDRVVEALGRPNKVQSWLRHDTSNPDKLADNTLAVFEYDKALAVVSTAARMFGSGQHRSFELIGSDGSFMVQPLGGNGKMTVAMREAKGPYKKGWQDITLTGQPRYIPDFIEMARAIKSNTPLKLSYDHELWVHETLLRASGEKI